MNKQYNGELQGDVTDEALEGFYQAFILPEFGLTGDIHWERHVRTDPDNFLHIFSVKNIRYALAFDDYPSGFSVGNEYFVKALRTSNGDETLHVEIEDRKYVENIYGYFMLFQVIDEEDFDECVEYLEAMHMREQQGWNADCRDVVVIARDMLQLAETASRSHDSTALYSLLNIVEAFLSLNVIDNNVNLYLLKKYIDILGDAEIGYERFSSEEREAVANQIYASLSEDLRRTMVIRNYEAKHLGETIKLVHAMYAKTDGDMTEGMSIVLTCEDDVISYPTDHFINDELRKYFANNPHITGRNVEYHLPEMLRGYRLVAETERSEYVFKRELDYVGL